MWIYCKRFKLFCFSKQKNLLPFKELKELIRKVFREKLPSGHYSHSQRLDLDLDVFSGHIRLAITPVYSGKRLRRPTDWLGFALCVWRRAGNHWWRWGLWPQQIGPQQVWELLRGWERWPQVRQQRILGQFPSPFDAQFLLFRFSSGESSVKNLKEKTFDLQLAMINSTSCPGAATPVTMCGRRTGGEAGPSRTQTPSSSARGRDSRRRCRSRRTKAARSTASWRSTR